MAGQTFLTDSTRENFTPGTGTIAAVMVAELEENRVGWLKPSEGDEDLSQDNKWRRQEVCDRCFMHKPVNGECC